MTPPNVIRRCSAALAIITATAAGLSACSSAPVTPTQLTPLEAVLAGCPHNSDSAVDVRVDESGSRRTTTLAGDDRTAVVDALTQAAVCGHGAGRFRLDLFSSSIAASDNVVDVTLETAGATDIARLRTVPAMMKRVLHTIDGRFAAAARSLPEGGTDLPAQLFAAKEFLEQVEADGTGDGSSFRLSLVLLTDGESNSPDSFVSLTSTTAAARLLALQTAVPNLQHATVLVAGVGNSAAGPSPSSTYVAALKSYLVTLCSRSNAAKVTVVTDYTGQGV